jgi:hypothetical protein
MTSRFQNISLQIFSDRELAGMYLTFVYHLLYFCGIYAISGKIKCQVRKKPAKNIWGGGGTAKVDYNKPDHCGPKPSFGFTPPPPFHEVSLSSVMYIYHRIGAETFRHFQFAIN